MSPVECAEEHLSDLLGSVAAGCPRGAAKAFAEAGVPRPYTLIPDDLAWKPPVTKMLMSSMCEMSYFASVGDDRFFSKSVNRKLRHDQSSLLRLSSCDREKLYCRVHLRTRHHAINRRHDSGLTA